MANHHSDTNEMRGIQAKLKMDNFSIATEEKNYYESMYKSKGIKQ